MNHLPAQLVLIMVATIYLVHPQLYTTKAQSPASPILQAGHSGSISAMAISPDARIIVTGDEYGMMKYWNRISNRLVLAMKAHRGRINVIEFSPDGKRLISGGEDSVLRLWDSRTGNLIKPFTDHTTPLNCVAFSPDGNLAVSGGGSYGEDEEGLADNVVRVWDIKAGKLINVLRGHTKRIVSVAFNSMGTQVLSGSLDNSIRIWAANGTSESVKIPTEAVNSVSFSPDNSTIASAMPKKVLFWNPKTGQQKNTIQHDEYASSVKFTADWRLMFVGSYEPQVWNVETALLVRTLKSEGEFSSVTPDGSFLATTGTEPLSVWDVSRNIPVMEFGKRAASPEWTTGVAFSKSGRLAGWIGPVNDANGKFPEAGSGIYVLDSDKFELKQVLSTADTGLINEVVFSPDERTLLTCGTDGPNIYTITPPKLVKNLNQGQPESFMCESATFSPDGNSIVLAGSLVPRKPGSSELDFRRSYLGIQIVDSKSLRLIRSQKLPTTIQSNMKDVIHSVAFSPNGTLFATGDDLDGLVLWDAQTGSATTIKAQQKGVLSVTFNPTGTQIATGGFNNTIKIWDISSRQVVRTLTGAQGPVSSVRYSSDGQSIISGSYDESIRIINLRTDKSTTLDGHSAPVNFVAVSPNGKLALSTGLDGVVNVWSIPYQTLVSSIYVTGSEGGVNFTPDGYFTELAEGGRGLLAWRLDSENLADSSQVNALNRPDLIRARSKGETPILSPREMRSEIPRTDSIPWIEYERMLKNEWREHKFYALVIGNDTYRNRDQWSTLKNSRNDAREIARLLESDYGFAVTPLYDATKAEVLGALNRFAARAEPNSSFLLFYSGHGELDEQFDQASWIPVDADRNRRTWISSEEVLNALNLVKSRHTLIVADSCFAGAFKKGRLPIEYFEEPPEMMLKSMKRYSRTLITSGGTEPVSGAGKGHSIFGEYLIHGMKKLPKNIFSANKLFYEFIQRDIVMNQLQQRPVIRDIGDTITFAPKGEKGDLFFLVRKYQ